MRTGSLARHMLGPSIRACSSLCRPPRSLPHFRNSSHHTTWPPSRISSSGGLIWLCSGSVACLTPTFFWCLMETIVSPFPTKIDVLYEETCLMKLDSQSFPGQALATRCIAGQSSLYGRRYRRKLEELPNPSPRRYGHDCRSEACRAKVSSCRNGSPHMPDREYSQVSTL